MATGSILHIPQTNPTLQLILAHVGAVLIGIAGPIVMAAPTALSAAWFPPDQRTTATAVAQVANGLGNGVSYLIGSLMVPDNDIAVSLSAAAKKGSNHKDSPSVADVQIRIQWYMIVLSIPAVLLFVALVVYFPSRPTLPPSYSASDSAERTPFFKSLVEFLKNKNAMTCFVALSLSNGVQGCWAGLLTLNFEPLGEGLLWY